MRRPTAEQFGHLLPRVQAAHRLIARLAERLLKFGYVRDDPYVLAVARAEDALHDVKIRTHYLSCAEGTAGFSGGYVSDVGLWLGDGI